jgi:hypothetical protein
VLWAAHFGRRRLHWGNLSQHCGCRSDRPKAPEVSCEARLGLAPTERRGDVGQDRLNDMGIVGDAKLVRDCQE